GALVRVVADERGLRDRRVDSPIDTREACRDLVHSPVQVVDPALERDCEVDEVLLHPSEQHELGRPHGAQLPPGETGHEQRGSCNGAGPDRGPFRGRDQLVLLPVMPSSFWIESCDRGPEAGTKASLAMPIVRGRAGFAGTAAAYCR